MRAAIADAVFRVRCSWWAPWALLAAAAWLAMVIKGAGWAAPLPLLAGAALIAAHPRLRARALDGLKLAPRAGIARYHWATWMHSNGKPFQYTANLPRQVVVGTPLQTPRIKRFERDGRRLVIIAESPSFFDSTMWRSNGDDLARGLRLPRPVIELDRARQEVRLTFAGGDGGIRPWQAKVPAALPDLAAVPVARTITGTAYVKILGSHLLITGATGSGKGSVVWSIIRELSPGIPNGTVELWAIDGKAGVELGMGRGLFSRFCGEIGSAFEPAMVALLEDAVALMSARLQALSGEARLHDPRPGAPFIVIIYDEFLTVVATMTDRHLRRRADAALKLLLSQGRAAAVVVVAASQLAQKETIGAIRDLIPTRVCLRVTDTDQVDLSLGSGARKAGARADEIGEDAPGTGYLLTDGRTPVMVRFPWMPDDAIRALADRYPAPTRPEEPARLVATGGSLADQPRPLKRDVVAALLADPTTADLSDDDIATRADCTPRYVRMHRSAVAKRGNGGPEKEAASRNKVPEGDPISRSAHIRLDTPRATTDNPGAIDVTWALPYADTATGGSA